MNSKPRSGILGNPNTVNKEMKPEPSNQDIMDKLNEIESLIRDGVGDAVIPEDGVSDIQGPESVTK